MTIYRRLGVFVGLVGLVVLLAVKALTASAGTFYVSTAGSPGGDGSIGNPWDLQTALNQPAAVGAGSTIYLRGGTYTGHFVSLLAGASGSPIVVRNYTGERATINGDGTQNNVFEISGGDDVWYWGLEFENTGKATQGATQAIIDTNTVSHRMKFINCTIHDGRIGLNTGETSQDLEVSGCLIYYNGTSSTEHNMYLQNLTGTKHILGNIVFDPYGYNLHGYTSGSHENNYDVQNNIFFRGGRLGGPTATNPSYFFKAQTYPITGISVVNNFDYEGDNGPVSLNLGDAGILNNDATVTGNYMDGGFPLDVSGFSTATVTGNTFIYRNISLPFIRANSQGGSPEPNTFTWNGNTYMNGTGVFDPQRWELDGTLYTFAQWKTASGLDSTSTKIEGQEQDFFNKVAVIPNLYEAGRANIVVYNWQTLPTVDIDFSSVMPAGSTYVLYNAQNFYGPPVLSGTYAGGNLAVPMTGAGVAVPVGYPAPAPTGPEFNAFVLFSAAPPPTATPTRTKPPTRTRTPTKTPTPTRTRRPTKTPTS